MHHTVHSTLSLTTSIIQNYRATSSSIYLLIHPSIHSSLHPFIPSSLHLFIPSSLHPFIPSSLHPFIPSFLHPFIPSSLHLFISSSIHPFIPSSSHPHIHPFIVETAWPPPLPKNLFHGQNQRQRDLIRPRRSDLYICVIRARQ